MWFRCPSSTLAPDSKSTPSDVPKSASSASCTASAVSGQDGVDVAQPDDFAEVADAARMHDERPRNENDAAAGLTHLAHHGRDLRDAHLDPALRRDVVRHERKAEPIALAKLRHNPHAVCPAHNQLPFAHVAQLPADCSVAVHDDDRIHPLGLHIDPVFLMPNPRPLIRRRVEIARHAPVRQRRSQERVALGQRMTAQRHEILQQMLKRRLAVGRHLEPQSRRVLVRAADREALDLERPGPFDHLVEDDVEQVGVDQVTFRFDDLGVVVSLSHASSTPRRARAHCAPSRSAGRPDRPRTPSASVPAAPAPSLG